MSMDPIAYTYEADTHCPGCALERFGRCPDGWIACADDPHRVTDREGNTVGVIAPWDEWHEDGPGRFTLVCGTCSSVIDECDHGSGMDDPDEDACECDACLADPDPTLGL